MEQGRVGRRVQAPTAPRPRRSALHALLLWTGLFAIYVANVQVVSSFDNVTTALLPFSIVREGNLDLDEFISFLGREGEGPSYVRQRGGHAYSGNTIVTPLLIAPLYVVPARWLAARNIPYDDVRAQLVVVTMERLVAAVLTALSATVLWLVLLNLTSPLRALAVTSVYALGSNTWAISSQGLWTHTLSELGLVMVSGVLLQPAPSALAMAAAGAIAGVTVANRPPMVLFALLATAFVALQRRRRLLVFLSVPVPAAALLVVYNLGTFQRAVGGYGDVSFSTPLWEGISGLLFSPNRGLLVFMPIAIFAVVGAIRIWRQPSPPWLRYLTIGIVLHLVLFAKFSDWVGGFTYGPRYLTDVLPAVCLLLPFGLWPLCERRAVGITAIVAALYGTAVQAVGVYGDANHWNQNPIPLYRLPQRVWDWSDLQIIATVRNGWHGCDLAPLIAEAIRGEEPARLTDLSRNDLASEVRAVGVPARATRGTAYPIDVEILNRGGRSWPAFRLDERPQNRVFLLVRWLRDGALLVGEGEVVALPENASPGERLHLSLHLVAPAQPGQLLLELSVAQALGAVSGVTGEGAARYPVTVE
jgi:hypothetical protein